MKKTKLIEILTEMMATSPARNWLLEENSTKEEIAKMRENNLAHIKFFAEEILKEKSAKKK